MVVFFTASELGFPFEFVSSVVATSVAVFATFEDGSSVFLPILADEGAEVRVDGDGASGNWTASVQGARLTFEGTGDVERYALTVDYPLYGIEGTFGLESVSSLFSRRLDERARGPLRMSVLCPPQKRW